MISILQIFSIKAKRMVIIEKSTKELSYEEIKKYGLSTKEDLYFGIKPTPSASVR